MTGMFVKSCLRAKSAGAIAKTSSSNARPQCRRSVSFRGKDADEVHPADDWDRTPVDVSAKLTYECVASPPCLNEDIEKANLNHVFSLS